MIAHRVPGIVLMPVCAGGRGFDRDDERFAGVRQGYVTWGASRAPARSWTAHCRRLTKVLSGHIGDTLFRAHG